MKKLSLLLLTLTVCFFTACHKDIWAELENLDQRVTKLEELCKEMNTNITSLQTIVSVLQSNDFITGIVEIKKNGEVIGYTITFGKHDPITIYHGQDGKDGADGKDGQDGQNGSANAPVIGVAQDTDGVYYWTLNGEWLLDDYGNKLPVSGKDGQNGTNGSNGQDGADGKDGQDGVDGQDGKDGITPQLKIEEGYWYISYDNGATWTQLGKATGEDGKDGVDGENGRDGQNGADGKDGQDGDSMFQSVTQDENYVYFTLADGTVIKIAKGKNDDFDQTVIDNLVNYFQIDKTTILLRSIGEKDTILWETQPFANSNVIWSSSDESILSVANGVVTANKYGYVIVTATAATKTQKCKVYIVDENAKLFSLSDTTKVVFAPGNLQYNAKEQAWRFAEKPETVIGEFNMVRSATYDGWIDLFSFGCNGYMYEPYEKGNYFYQPNSNYGNLSLTTGCPRDLSKTNFDWGWYNSISNGGNSPQEWRTMTYSEVQYLDSKRTNAANLKIPATLNGICGWIIFPDNFVCPSILNLSFTATTYAKNLIDDSTWQILSAYGAVFLPNTGMYSWKNNSIKNPNMGFYWTSSTAANPAPYYYELKESSTQITTGGYENYDAANKLGYAVRLVKDVE